MTLDTVSMFQRQLLAVRAQAVALQNQCEVMLAISETLLQGQPGLPGDEQADKIARESPARPAVFGQPQRESTNAGTEQG